MATVTAVEAAARQSRAAPSRRYKAGARGAILIAGLLLAAGVVRMGLAVRLIQSDPASAAKLAPGDAQAMLATARTLVGKTDEADSRRMLALAQASLARDLTNPGAIELVALQADRTGRKDKAGRLFALSNRISRRSLPTRLWLIQQAVDGGDVAGALIHFDIALRTSTDAPPLLFPVLARAAGDPSLAVPIARLLDQRRDWRLAFLHDSALRRDSASGLADVLLHMRDRSSIAGNGIDSAIVAQLLASGQFQKAFRLQNAFHPMPGDGRLIRDPDFFEPQFVYPFGWSLTRQGDINAERGRVANRPALTYQATAGGAGAAATQLLLLAPGHYDFSVETAAPSSDVSAQPFWTITCAEHGGAQLVVADQPDRAGAWLSADLRVPEDCPAQWLTLLLRSGDSTDGLSGAVTDVTIVRR